MNKRGTRQPVGRAGLVLGFGLGGFFDGIVLHQVLQWHHLISNVEDVTSLEGLRANVVADGLFHAAMWLAVGLGLVMLWHARAESISLPPTRVLVGSILTGWGIFHVVDELINHRLLGLHHIRPGPNELLWDFGFFGIGLLLIVLGRLLVRQGRAEPA